MPEAKKTWQADLDLLVAAAKEGGALALSYYLQDPENWKKEGDSPVSEADIAVDKLLFKLLKSSRPDYGWLSEETVDDLDRLNHETTFIVDPIDGTRVFLAGSTEWCLSLAVVQKGRPVVGVIFCPVRDELYTAVAGQGSYLNSKPITVSSKETLDQALISGPKTFLQSKAVEQQQIEFGSYLGSLAYRFALVARGGVDAGVARARAKDWDLAAADLIVQEAGGQLVDLHGTPPTYNKISTNHPGLVACSAKMFKRLQEISV